MRGIVSNSLLSAAAVAFINIAGLSTASAQNFVVKAKENSIYGGTGLITGVSVMPGKLLVISIDKQAKWSRR